MERLEYAAGVAHGAGAAASSEHETDVEFVVANEKLADVVEVVEAGCETMVTVGGGVTVHEYDAFVESEPDVAVTVNTCAPGAIPVKVAGAEHGAGVPVSMEQLTDAAFVATNENVAEVEEVLGFGPERMFTAGGGVTVHGYDVLAESEPEVAVTVNMCAPGAMPEYDTGDAHGDGEAASTEQVSADAFVAEKENEADVDDVLAPGPERIVIDGADDDAVTVQVTSAVWEPLALAARMARTWVPTERPVSVVGEVQSHAGLLSSAHDVVVAPWEVHATVAIVADVVAGGR